HAHDYKTDLLAWLLAKAEDVIPLSTVHGWTGHTSRELWLYYPLDKWILSFFPKLIAVSSDVKNELVGHWAQPEDVVTVLNGSDPPRSRRAPARGRVARQALGVTGGEGVIGAVGRLEPQKRFDLLVDAFAEVNRQHPDTRLLIAGDGSLRSALDAQIAQR